MSTVDSASDDRTANNSVRHNYRVLTDADKATSTFKVHATNKSDPLRIYCDDPDALFILMPMRGERA